MEIAVIKAELHALEVDALVCPSPIPRSGEADPAPDELLVGVLERAGTVLRAGLEGLPLPQVGQARILEAGGALPFRHVIQAPVVSQAGGAPSLEDIKRAILAAVRCAEDHRVRTLAFPVLWGWSHDERLNVRLSRALVAVLSSIEPAHLARVFLVTPELSALERLEEAVASFGG